MPRRVTPFQYRSLLRQAQSKKRQATQKVNSEIRRYNDLDLSERTNDVLENFIVANIDNVITLFDDLNSGEHGRAGKFSLQQLVSIKIRVEDAIRFMCEIVRPASLQ